MGELAASKGKKKREEVEALLRSRRNSLSGETWKTGEACASTVRAASLSRTRGSTTSGLFSDVQMLAGSEFEAAVLESRSCEWRPRKEPRRRVKRGSSHQKTKSTELLSRMAELNWDDLTEVDRRLPHERIADEFFETDSESERDCEESLFKCSDASSDCCDSNRSVLLGLAAT